MERFVLVGVFASRLHVFPCFSIHIFPKTSTLEIVLNNDSPIMIIPDVGELRQMLNACHEVIHFGGRKKASRIMESKFWEMLSGCFVFMWPL